MTFHVNGETRQVAASPTHTLLEVLREELDLTGTKHGCELGHCGACTVLVDGEPILSCLMLAVEAQDAAITTVEGLAERQHAAPAAASLRRARRGAVRLLHAGLPGERGGAAGARTSPSRDEIKAALAGNLCRCTGYTKIIEAVELAAERMRPHPPAPSSIGEGE